MSKISDTFDYEYNKLYGEDSEEQIKRINNKKIQILCVGGIIILLIVTAVILPLLFVCYSTEETQNVGEKTKNITQDTQEQTSQIQYIPHRTFIEESEIEKSSPGQKKFRTSTPRYKKSKSSKKLEETETSLSNLDLSSIEGSGLKPTFFDSEEFDQEKSKTGTKRKRTDGQINPVRKRLNFTGASLSNNQDLKNERLEQEKLEQERLERERLEKERLEKLEKERLEQAKKNVGSRRSTRLTRMKKTESATHPPE